MLFIVTVCCCFLILITEIRTLLWSQSNTCQHINPEKMLFSGTWWTLLAMCCTWTPTAFHQHPTLIPKRRTHVRLTEIYAADGCGSCTICFPDIIIWFTPPIQTKPRWNLCVEELRAPKQTCLTATKGQRHNPQSGILINRWGKNKYGTYYLSII